MDHRQRAFAKRRAALARQDSKSDLPTEFWNAVKAYSAASMTLVDLMPKCMREYIAETNNIADACAAFPDEYNKLKNDPRFLRAAAKLTALNTQ